jgi:hypothetical protein
MAAQELLVCDQCQQKEVVLGWGNGELVSALAQADKANSAWSCC